MGDTDRQDRQAARNVLLAPIDQQQANAPTEQAHYEATWASWIARGRAEYARVPPNEAHELGQRVRKTYGLARHLAEVDAFVAKTELEGGELMDPVRPSAGGVSETCRCRNAVRNVFVTGAW